MSDRHGTGPERRPEPDPGAPSATSEPSGERLSISDVTGQAVQAQQVHGGVHFHTTEPPAGPVPRQLPADVHGFVNRVGELEMLSSRLRDESGQSGEDSGHGGSAIHLITGTAGVGKTALALHWAHRVRGRFPDGQLHVDLRGYGSGAPADPSWVLDRFLRALGVPADAVPPDTDSRAALYRSQLADRRTLIMLDNAASAAQVRPLLPGASSCVVLVTSRDRLPGLVSHQGAHRLTVRSLSPEQAVDLLVHVTEGHRTGDTPRDVAELARLCGRLPLALCIAAERAASRPHMPLHDLIRDLKDESSLWDALATDDEEEAYAVRSVFAWSYRVLPGTAARLFRLLGLHPGTDFDSRAASVLADVSTREARQALDVLVSAHLLEQISTDRYRFHDLLRSYAHDQTRQEESPQAREEALARLLRWYLHTADAAARASDSHLRHLPQTDLTGNEAEGFRDRTEAARWFERENANLVAAVRTAASTETSWARGTAWRLAVVLRHFHVFHAPVATWVETGEVGLAAARQDRHPGAEADLLESLGMAHLQANRAEEALAHQLRALDLRRSLNDGYGVAMSLNSVGLVRLRTHRLDAAREHFQQSLRLARDLGERLWEGIALGNLASVLLELNEPGEAINLAEWAVAIHRETGDRITEFATLACLGTAWQRLGDLPRALSCLEEALEVARDPGDLTEEAYALLQLGRVRAELADQEEALACFHHSAALHRRIADRRREAECFEGVGGVYAALGLREESARFLRQAASGYRGCGDHWRLAACLHRLALTVAALGEAERAREHWTEALELLEGFDDPAARSLVEEVRGASALRRE